MNEPIGQVYRIGQENPPIPGCTTSATAWQRDGFLLAHFSLAAHTDISPESFPGHKLIMAADGPLQVTGSDGATWDLEPGQVFATPADTPIGTRTDTGCVYTELTLEEGIPMNEALNIGEVVKLADLLPYQDGKIVNMDLVNTDHVKLALMSFGAGTGLSEHAAPRPALVFALDGTGIIGYEGTEHTITAGENFAFAKGGRHYVKADGPFKMALLLVDE